MLDLVALSALNHLLDAAPWARARLAPFAGRRARIELSAPALELEFRIAADGRVESLGAGDADVTLCLGDLPALLRRDDLLRGVRVEGAADFADALNQVLRHLRWDAEADLARGFGDIAARRLAGAARALALSHVDAARRLAGNLGEYLRFEQPAWPAPPRAAGLAARLAEAEALASRLARVLRGPAV